MKPLVDSRKFNLRGARARISDEGQKQEQLSSRNYR